MASTVHLPEQELIRSKIIVEGIVQGVGFRPFIYNLAKSHNLKGYVLNNQQGVQIEVEGESANLTIFLQDILKKLPPQAHIVRLEEKRLPPVNFTDFEIKVSADHEERTALISPDLAVCNDCLEELFDSEDRRYRYPLHKLHQLWPSLHHYRRHSL